MLTVILCRCLLVSAVLQRVSIQLGGSTTELHEEERESITLLPNPTTSNAGTVLKKTAEEASPRSQLALPLIFITTTFLQAG